MVSAVFTKTGNAMGLRKNSTFVERAERWPVSLRGFALNTRHDSDIEVSDLSYAGCRFDSASKFKRGEIVELRLLKRGAIEAEIRWSADGHSGARFVG
jgi:hypothetical protein